MALRITNPLVVGKVERLARITGLSKTGVVNLALDSLTRKTTAVRDADSRMAALLSQLDRIPDRPDAFDSMVWDEQGLPR